MASIVNGLIVSAVLWTVFPQPALVAWAGLMIAVAALRLQLRARYRRLRPPAEDAWRWARLYVLGAGLNGALWGLTATSVFVVDSIPYHAFVAFVIAGMGAGAVAVNAVYLPALNAYLWASAAPLALSFLIRGEFMYEAMGVMVALFVVLLSIFGWVFSRPLIATFKLQLDNAELIGHLLAARDLAESIVAAGHHPTVILDGNLDVVSANQAFHDFFSTKPEQIEKCRFLHLGGGVWEAAGLRGHLEQVLEHGTELHGLEVEADPDGAGATCLLVDARRIQQRDRQTQQVLLTITDITELRRADAVLRRSHDELEQLVQERTAELRAANQALAEEIAERERAERVVRDNERQMRMITDNLPVLISYVDEDERYIFANKVHETWFGRPLAEILGKRTDEVLDPAVYEQVRPRIAKALGGENQTFEVTMDRPNDSPRHFSLSLIPHIEDGGAVRGFFSLARHITKRKQAEQALRESRDQIRAITDNLPVLIAYIDSDIRYRFVNQTCVDWYAHPADQIIGKSIKDFDEGLYEEARPDIEAVLAGTAVNLEKTISYPDGVERAVRILYLPHRGPESQILGFFALVEDISDYKRTEEQLRQAQKMEAVGQLTGGVAHDFNNLLAIILGNLQLLENSLDEDDKRQDLVRPALRAVTRGGELTHRLLAFSRRQPLKPEVTNLNALVSGMSYLLTRTLGETIRIETALEDELWGATVDQAQMESALLNLAVNSRHAMPEGGTLTIETANVQFDRATARPYQVPPGSYVVVKVADTGCGMTPEVAEQALEPFFTTRKVGQGSGLGLSMVYGFVKQSGGGIAIESKAGQGTTIKLCFPWAMGEPRQAARAEPAADRLAGTGETILVVEDDPDVREVAKTLLSDLGYRILSAADGRSALAVLDRSQEVELLFTDVVLPRGMNGLALAQQAKARRPALKVLYTSGYADEANIGVGILQDGVNLLRKPYAKAALAERIRQTLDDPAT